MICSAIFCEDIRHEVGDKRSFIGVHNVRSKLAHFPFLFPKFCVVIYAHSSKAESPKKVSALLRLGDQVIAEMPEADYSAKMRAASAISDGDHSLLSLEMVMSPFVIESPSDMSIELNLDGEKIALPKLQFVQLSPADAAKVSSKNLLAEVSGRRQSAVEAHSPKRKR
jgi:hypothetical protein